MVYLDKWDLVLIAECLYKFFVCSLITVLSQYAKDSLPPNVHNEMDKIHNLNIICISYIFLRKYFFKLH